MCNERELRFLVTQKCNYNCIFCHKEGLQDIKKNFLNPSDYGFLFSVGRNYFALNHSTLTGGEPLSRPDIVDIAATLFKESAKLTLTTNGLLLAQHMAIGKYINKINLSLHTLNKNKYETIVGRKRIFNKVVNNILTFHEKYPQVKICLNSTFIDENAAAEEEMMNLFVFAEKINASVKYVELFPVGAKGFVPLERIIALLIKHNFHSIPSNTRKLNFSNNKIDVGLTKIFCSTASQQENPAAYCKKNNDLFVSPDGKIKPCRNNMQEVDFLQAVKDRNEILLAKKIKQAFNTLGNECIYKTI